jgi:outer membrane protein
MDCRQRCLSTSSIFRCANALAHLSARLALVFVSSFLLTISLFQSGLLSEPVSAAGREVPIPDVQFQPIRPTRAISIREAVAIALRNFPAIANKQFKLRAALANVTLARTQYLPNFNLDLQEMRATHNVISGTIMNNVSGLDTIPIEAGTPSHSSSMSSDWDSNQGANLNWLMVDFGLRKSNVKLATTDARVARADLTLTRLDVAYGAADAYLTAIAAKQTIRSTQATLDRMEAAKLVVNTVFTKGLQPGVDSARADFDVSESKIELIKAERATKLALVDLAEQMGIANADVEVISEPLVRSPILTKRFGPFDLTSHPLALFKEASIERWAAKVHLIDRTYYPHLWFNGSMWGRGSGITGQSRPVASGILPQAGNYMFGVTLAFPVMEIFPLKAERKAAVSNEMAERADFDLAIQILERKDARARIMLAEARRIARETPIMVDSARENEIKVVERYRTGLTNMVAVAEAERILARAEVEDALAQIDVWRSILALSYVQGDLDPFLQLVAIAEGNTQRPNI